MPLQPDMKIISVDDHLVEQPNLWQDRLPAEHREGRPRIIEDEQGHHVWRYEGQLYPQIGLNAVAGKDPHEYGMEPVRYDDMIPGCYDPAAAGEGHGPRRRARGAVLPVLPRLRRRGLSAGQGQGARAGSASRRGTTSRSTSGARPHRTGSSRWRILPTWDPELAAAEVERVAGIRAPRRSVSRRAHPARAAVVPHRPLGAGCGTPARTPTCPCACTSVRAASCPASRSLATMLSSQDGAPFAVAISDLLDQPHVVDGRHPVLRHAAAAPQPEVHAVRGRHRLDSPTCSSASTTPGSGTAGTRTSTRTTRPSDLFREHFWGCFIDDVHGVDNRARDRRWTRS